MEIISSYLPKEKLQLGNPIVWLLDSVELEYFQLVQLRDGMGRQKTHPV
jgi:hypothetical protein